MARRRRRSFRDSWEATIIKVIVGIFKQEGFDFPEVKRAIQADLALMGCSAANFRLTEEKSRIADIIHTIVGKTLYQLSYDVSGNENEKIIHESLYIVCNYKMKTFRIHGIRDSEYFKQM